MKENESTRRKKHRPSNTWVVILIPAFLGCAGVLTGLFSYSFITVLIQRPTALAWTTLTQTPFLPATATLTPAPTLTPSNTPEPTNTPTTTLTPTPTIDPWVEEYLNSMTLPQKIGQMIMTGVDGQEINATTCNLVQRLLPGAVVYRGGNVVSPDQLREFSAGLQSCAQVNPGIPLMIAVDHEGQYVIRFDRGITFFPAAMAVGATSNPDYAYLSARASGSELALSGVNTVLGPVADVLTNYDNTVISIRAFGGDPQLVSELVAEAVLGYKETGIIPVLKHFPGHGGTDVDSHYSLPVDASNRQELDESYLPPFRSGINAGAQIVMLSHVAFPSLDGSVAPATLSTPIVNLLREDLGFDGIILTDSMGMGAITSSGMSVVEASLSAVRAGIDMLLITSPTQAKAVSDRLLEAVRQGEIPEEKINESVRRILVVKADSGLKSFPIDGSSPPDWKENSNLSYEVGYHAVTLIQDMHNLVPIPENLKQILIIGPTDAWGLYPNLNSILEQNGHIPTVYRYSTPWNGPVPESSYLVNLPKLAEDYDLVLVLTWEAHLNRLRFDDNWQVQLIENLLEVKKPLIVVALKSPTDFVDFSKEPTFVATFGTTRGQLQALADILVGNVEPSGKNPLPGLP